VAAGLDESSSSSTHTLRTWAWRPNRGRDSVQGRWKPLIVTIRGSMSSLTKALLVDVVFST
jgi:hypothetical protein